MEFTIATPVSGVSLAGATTPVGRTVLMLVNNDANVSAVIKQINVSFNGVTAANSPVLVELVKSSQATNGALGQAVTPVQWRGAGNNSGQGLTAKLLGYAGYVSEPTILTTLDEFWVPPTTGALVPLPLGDEPEIVPGVGTMGIGLRITAAQAVSVVATMRFMQGVT